MGYVVEPEVLPRRVSLLQANRERSWGGTFCKVVHLEHVRSGLRGLKINVLDRIVDRCTITTVGVNVQGTPVGRTFAKKNVSASWRLAVKVEVGLVEIFKKK